MANKTVYPFGTGGQLPSSIGIINDLTTGGADKALSAEMGKRIAELSQIIGTTQSVSPQSVLTKSYVNSSGEIKSSGTATTTVAYYPIDGNPLSVIIGKTANSATRVLSLAEDDTQKTGLVVLTEKMGDDAAYEPSELLSYSPKYKYLVVCYNNSAENVIKLNKVAIPFAQLTQLLYLAREYSLDFDETKCIVDRCYIDYETGNAVTSGYWRSTDFIEIPEDVKWYNYTTSNTGSSPKSGFAFYDNAKQYIKGIHHVSNVKYSGAIPSNAKYVRFCYYATQSASTSISLYSVGAIGFKAWLEDAVNREDELVQKLSKDITKTYTTDDCIINGKFIDRDTGDATNYSSFICSDFIETFGETIVVTSSWATTGSSGFCFYDSEKQYISGHSVTQVTDVVYQIPENAKYLRFTSKFGETNTFTMSLSGVDGLIYLIEHIDTDEKEETKERHILMVGNSFTMHACEYLQTICNNLGVDNITLQYIYTSGASLKTYAENLNTTRSLTTAVNGGNPFGGGTLPNIFKGNWDIIVFQQASSDSPDYDTYIPYLRQLIDCALENCPNKDLQIMFNMTWAYSDDDGTMWQGILAANRKLRDDYGHIVRATIASGAAVANIRRSLGVSLSYDNHHLSQGVGRYVAGCILYTSLIMPYSGVSIYDDTTVIDVSGDSTAGAVSVTNDNRLICQQAVMSAYIDPWSDYIDESVDPTPTGGSSNPVSSGGVYQALLGKSDKRISATEIPVSGCTPDVVYGLGITDNVTVTLEAASDEYEHLYTVRWTCRSSQCVVTLPSNIKLPNGSSIEPATGRRFELVIDKDGYATVKYWDASNAEI